MKKGPIPDTPATFSRFLAARATPGRPFTTSVSPWMRLSGNPSLSTPEGMTLPPSPPGIPVQKSDAEKSAVWSDSGRHISQTILMQAAFSRCGRRHFRPAHSPRKKQTGTPAYGSGLFFILLPGQRAFPWQRDCPRRISRDDKPSSPLRLQSPLRLPL